MLRVVKITALNAPLIKFYGMRCKIRKISQNVACIVFRRSMSSFFLCKKVRENNTGYYYLCSQIQKNMNLEKLVAVSGLPGLYRMTGNRGNGVIVEDLDNGKSKFASMRKHQFTPLESIAIYTDNDSVALSKVFRNMLEQKADNPPADANGKVEDIKEYFADVVPDYDRDQVHLSDMKKVIKWFNFLDARNLLSLDDDAPAEEDNKEEEE